LNFEERGVQFLRITNKMLSDSFLTDMQVNLNNLRKIQQQTSSTKNFSKPSDDPFNVVRSMQLHTDINANAQYKTNIVNALNFMDTTDTALNQIGNVLSGIREKLVSAGDAAYGSDERGKIKDEINQRISQIAQLLNTNFQGDYIFGGTRGLTKPVTTEEYTIGSDTGNVSIKYLAIDGSTLDYDPANQEIISMSSKRKVEVSQGVVVEYNATAPEILNYGNGADDNIPALLDRIVKHLASDDEASTKALTNEDLSDIDEASKQLLKVRSEVGAKANRMESMSDQNDDTKINMTEVLSKTEDIDITEKTIEYYTMITVYQASLQTSARVMQPTLMDYIS
jgi:flagellar hook-associated protein 3 FlgL